MYGAIDIGGTKTILAVFDNKGKLIENIKFTTNKDYQLFLEELADNVASLTTKNFYRVVVALPGIVNHKKGIGVAFGNLPWKLVHVSKDFELIFHAPVVVENDAKLAALSEAKLLKKKYRKVLYVTISTGIGSGFVIDGKLAPDFKDIEPGHMLLEHNDRLVRWEKFASGKAVFEKYGKKFEDINDHQIWYAISRNIALGLINIIAILTPDVIIIGGGAGSQLNKFKDRLDEQLKIYENPMLTLPIILKAQNPNEAVINGCYQLAIQHHAKINN